jgi:hypothetical protein
LSAFTFSGHALEQMRLRGITEKEVLEILTSPDSIKEQEETTIFQGLTHRGKYLLRVFTDRNKKPAVIITVYRTSKISKYLP